MNLSNRYNFSRADLVGETLAQKYGNTKVFPLVLDWAIGRNEKVTCPPPLKDGDNEKLYFPYGVCISISMY